MTQHAVIVGAAESPYSRHPPPNTTTESLLVDAYVRVLQDAEIAREIVDGLGVASFTLKPDHVADLAWRLGIRARWLMEDTNGGASALNMLQHAVRAVESGDAEVIVLLAGDHFDAHSFANLVATYNRVTEELLAPIPAGGPNALFALVTQEHMKRNGLERRDYGRLVVAQRRWAGRNPHAVYREPLSLADYLDAPLVAPPLHRFDCVPVVSGADAIVVARRGHGVRIRAFGALHNFDNQEGDGLSTGLAQIRGALWEQARASPDDIDVLSIYDDYPVMVLVQLADLGFVSAGNEIGELIERIAAERLPLNTSGGQLSAGQAGAAGGMHGLVEVVTQLQNRGDERQVRDARLGLVTGYGMVLYRYGACSNAVVLERV